VGDLIIVTCIDQTFVFICSEDLTWSKLRTEVTLFMYCSPRELEFVAKDIDLEMTMELGTIDPAAFGSHASQIHFRVLRNAGSEDGEMEDVG
jgi:hypothetical protein